MSKIENLLSSDFFPDATLRLRIIERNPQVPFPLHSHDFAELVIILSGTGLHYTEGAEYIVQEGDVFVIERGYLHGYRDPQQLRLYNIIFDPELLRQACLDIHSMPGYQAIFLLEPRFREEHAFSSRLRLNDGELENVTRLVGRMNLELDRSSDEAAGSGSRALAFASLIELIVFLARSYPGRASGSSLEIDRLADLFAFMETNIESHLSVEELCGKGNMSASTLNREFQRAVGCAPIDYHLRLKIERAALLLERTRRPVTEIAAETGFSDSNYFSRQFRRRIGVSPRDYRKQHRLQW